MREFSYRFEVRCSRFPALFQPPAKWREASFVSATWPLCRCKSMAFLCRFWSFSSLMRDRSSAHKLCSACQKYAEDAKHNSERCLGHSDTLWRKRMNSIWSQSCNIRERECLPGNLEVEAVVIGAGIAGILTAFAYRRLAAKWWFWTPVK